MQKKRNFANTDDTWIEEVEAMRDICTLNGIEPLVERSRSGKGAHIWIFFDKPISAAVVRKFGFALLDKGAEQVNLKSFNYYDRMLPAQDSLENVAIGNLIALPLQGRALKDGNSAFVDSNWNAYSDQWNALLSKPKLSEEFLENKIREWTFTADDLEASSDEENREKPWDRMKNLQNQMLMGKWISHYQMVYMLTALILSLRCRIRFAEWQPLVTQYFIKIVRLEHLIMIPQGGFILGKTILADTYRFQEDYRRN